MGNILSTTPNQQTVRIMTTQPALTPARTINSQQQQQQQHRIISVSSQFVDYTYKTLQVLICMTIIKLKYNLIFIMMVIFKWIYYIYQK